jgi:4-hydroxybenzoate polyprenyltransferase
VVDALSQRNDRAVRVDPSLVRSGQWWDHKIPPLVAAAALTTVPGSDLDGVALVVDLCLFLVAAVGVAAFGHVVNDLADLRSDALAGKANQMQPLTATVRTGVLAVTIAAGLVPWVWLPRTSAVLGLLAVEVGLLVVYSVPPVRLKDRSTLGALADALYAYVVPILLTIAVFSEVAGTGRPPWAILAMVAAWSLLMGLRGIVWHQVADLANDRRAGVRTVATKIGAERASRLLGALVVAELVAAVTTLVAVAVGAEAPWVGFFAVGYLLYRMAQMALLWSEPVRLSVLRHASGRIRFLGFVLLNEFVEKWLPLAALVGLAVHDPVLWAVVAAHVALFENAAVEVVRRDLPALPDAVNRLAHEHKSRRLIRQMAERRRSETRRGPAELSEQVRSSRRWVFVVCGGELHIDTLRTAVTHLRPLTSLEIWVVTDSSRNVHPIDQAGIDGIVDVATPSEMDDHQASIWLKTSVHRRLPPGEWCYLDSDVIAVRPGLEEVFDHRHGPVAFASDLMIPDNCVDRFSPWAMTCDCAGHGDEHSCGHLRDQLQVRFDLTVPGDWLHWNGGVFVFGEDSWEFLDLWHRNAIESFAWPEWRTRDQGALIATAWTTGNQDCPRLPSGFNFIADLGSSDLCLDPDKGWAVHPQGPWHRAMFLHLYTSRLEDPTWDLGRDVEAPVIRQTLVRVNRWKRFVARQQIGDKGRHAADQVGMRSRATYWQVRTRIELYWLRTRRTFRRMRPSRIAASYRRRTGRAPDFGDIAREPTTDAHGAAPTTAPERTAVGTAAGHPEGRHHEQR